MNHQTHYKLLWVKNPSKYITHDHIFFDTLIHADESKIIPSFGFSPKNIAKDYVRWKKRGMVLILDLHTNHILYAAQYKGSSTKKTPKRSRSRGPSKRRKSSKKRSTRSNKRSKKSNRSKRTKGKSSKTRKQRKSY